MILVFIPIVLLCVWGINLYNKMVMLRHNVDKSFANLEVLLKQRADEIPNLVAVVKANTAYETALLTSLTELRTQFLNSRNDKEKIALGSQLEGGIKSLFAVSEAYPDLKSNNNFTLLQQRVSQTEDALSDRREFYNESVTLYNISINEFPAKLLADISQFREKSLFEVTETERQYDGIKF